MFRSIICFMETPAAEQRRLLCKLVEHFYEENRKTQVSTGSTPDAQQIDQLLWTFSDTSFIPHRIHDSRDGDDFIEPVLITVGDPVVPGFDALICDSPQSLDVMSRFRVAVHFVIRDDDERRLESRRMWLEARERKLIVRHVPFSSGIDWSLFLDRAGDGGGPESFAE